MESQENLMCPAFLESLEPSGLSCAGRSAGLIPRSLFYLIRLKALYLILIWNFHKVCRYGQRFEK